MNRVRKFIAYPFFLIGCVFGGLALICMGTENLITHGEWDV